MAADNRVALEAINKETVDLENIPIEEVFENLRCTEKALSKDEVQKRLDSISSKRKRKAKFSSSSALCGILCLGLWKQPQSWLL